MTETWVKVGAGIGIAIGVLTLMTWVTGLAIVTAAEPIIPLPYMVGAKGHLNREDDGIMIY